MPLVEKGVKYGCRTKLNESRLGESGRISSKVVQTRQGASGRRLWRGPLRNGENAETRLNRPATRAGEGGSLPSGRGRSNEGTRRMAPLGFAARKGAGKAGESS